MEELESYLKGENNKESQVLIKFISLWNSQTPLFTTNVFRGLSVLSGMDLGASSSLEVPK